MLTVHEALRGATHEQHTDLLHSTLQRSVQRAPGGCNRRPQRARRSPQLAAERATCRCAGVGARGVQQHIGEATECNAQQPQHDLVYVNHLLKGQGTGEAGQIRGARGARGSQ